MNQIKAVRTAKGISQADVAKALHISRQAVSLYEKGKREPRIETWKQLSKFLGVPVEYLQGRSESISNPIASMNKELNDTLSARLTKMLPAIPVSHLTNTQKAALMGLITYIEKLQATGLPDNSIDLAVALTTMSSNFPPVFDDHEEMEGEKAANKHSFAKFVDSYYKNAQFVQPQK
jgi:transcriptional regulator with XRE-family HTH domain